MAIDFRAVDAVFPRYTDFPTDVPVWCLTPDGTGYIHRFFDTSPVSPSGRFVALTRLPTEDCLPSPGTPAHVEIVDLIDGSCRTVATTAGWDTQLGAGAQWGATDRELLFNGVDTQTWTLSCHVVDPVTPDAVPRVLPGSVYMVAPRSRSIVSASLDRTSRTQEGYGVRLPEDRMPENTFAPADDGIWVTDIDSGSRRLVISLADIVSQLLTEEDLARLGPGSFYGFHTKWSSTESRILFVLRFLPNRETARPDAKSGIFLVAVDADGNRPKMILPPFLWSDRGGHHPNWMPTGSSVLMNLRNEAGVMRFVAIDADGFQTVRELSQTIVGGGHPSVEPTGRYLVTDAYLYEGVAFGDGTTPIRLIDLAEDTERTIVRVRTEPLYTGEKNILRVDPHPAWDPSFEGIVFNACPTGRRQVFLADLREAMQ